MQKRVLIVFMVLSTLAKAQSSDYTKFVNPFIGTGGHGHTFPGAVVPFGMVQLSPDTRVDGSWDGCSGYHYSDKLIYGFSHTHLSGTGCSDYGDIMLMPTNKATTDPKEYASPFSKESEKAEPGYYAVKLDNGDIQAELTVTTRCGFHRYTSSKPFYVVLDLTHRDELLKGEIKIINDSTIQGFRYSKAWAQHQKIYYYMRFSKAFKEIAGLRTPEKTCLAFDGKKPLLVTVGISAVSIENAQNNLDKEISNWYFERTKEEARFYWRRELHKIEVKGGSDEQKTVFYTALYHTMIHPSLFTDASGEYLGRDLKPHKADAHQQYTVFSLWDTFRGLHPLLSLIDTKRTADFINTFIRQYEQGGRLPVWELSANETDCMIGYHSVSVIADAMLKDLKGFDYEKAYLACKHSAMLDHLGLAAYKANGYISADDEAESVSKTLEYAYDDWCIARMANKLGKMEDYKYFIQRAQSYKNLFDPSTGHMRPRKNGGWLKPFDPREVNNHFTEGNSWQYSFFVPQDMIGLMGLYKGADKMEAKLDELFTAPVQTTGRDQADITGLIGQYAQGNEPSHHMAYLYNYVGKPYKTQEKVHFILNNFYKNDPDGLIGNEDCGQMSAWYVLSALGMYCVTPGSNVFTLSSPLFPEAIIHLENGRNITIKARGLSDKNFYIQSDSLNGKPYNNAFISWSDLQQKTELIYTMGAEPSLTFGANPDDKWLTAINDNKILTSPVIQATSGKAFRGTTDVAILSTTPDAVVHYTTNGSKPTAESPVYKSFITLTKSDTLKAVAIKDEVASTISTACFYKVPHEWGIKIKGNYNAQYTAGGDDGLIDGLRGTTNWRKGDWQGYQDQDFEALLDLKQEQTITEVGAGFLQDARAWIMMPAEVSFEVSSDGITFNKVASIKNAVPDTALIVQCKDFTQHIPTTWARFVRVTAKNYGKLPPWHQGAGYPAFIFTDEVWVKKEAK